MVEMGMGEKQKIDAGRIEAEGTPVLLVQFVSALVHAAIHEDAFTIAFDEMAGTGDLSVGSMKGYFHDSCSSVAITSAGTV